MKELVQLTKQQCWNPVHVEESTEKEKEKAVEAIMLLAEKHTVEVKGRFVYNSNESRDWLSRQRTTSPTASLEAIITTCVIDAFEERDVMSVDIPNAFIQTEMPEVEAGEERVIMKITGTIVDCLIEIDPGYREYVVYENGKRVLCTAILRAIYDMLIASLLFYKTIRGDLEGVGFIFNPYDPCVANREVEAKQQTIRFHVDELLSSHMNPKVNDDFLVWLKDIYGSYKKCTSTRGKVHVYLGMTLDFSSKGKLKIRMDDCVSRMLEEFPVKFDKDDLYSRR